MSVSTHKNTIVGTLMVDMWKVQGVEFEERLLDNIVSVGSLTGGSVAASFHGNYKIGVNGKGNRTDGSSQSHSLGLVHFPLNISTEWTYHYFKIHLHSAVKMKLPSFIWNEAAFSLFPWSFP